MMMSGGSLLGVVGEPPDMKMCRPVGVGMYLDKMEYIGLTEGTLNFSAAVRLPQGTGLKGGQGDLDRPTIIRYQDGVEPTFPLVAGGNLDRDPVLCLGCGQVLALGVVHGQLVALTLLCHCGQGVDFL